jgi:phytoene dehydrogenase-like protein
MSKKVIIVGGGIAGLSAGVYARKCGFDVTILESHSIAGGICTSWKRKGYLIEGGMHWLAGSSQAQPMNKMWRHIGALDDSVAIISSEPFIEYRHKETPIRIYRDVDATERHLLELSPADTKEIKNFCKNIRKLKKLIEPITDIKGVKVTKKNRMTLSALLSFLPVISVMSKYSKVSVAQYATRFKHEGIREMFSAMPGNEQGIAMLIMTLGALARGGVGFPEGGSLPFAGRIVNTFTSLGGEILYNTPAEKVIVENNRVVGVMAGGKRMSADAVIITSDTMAIDHFFDTPPKAAWLDEMRKVTEPTSAVFVSLGINADLRHYPSGLLFKFKNPIKISNVTIESLLISNYASDPYYSPEGKTIMTMQLPGDTYDYWKKLKEEGDEKYTEEKKRISNEIIAEISAFMPETDGKVEVCDVATPLTYERGKARG